MDRVPTAKRSTQPSSTSSTAKVTITDVGITRNFHSCPKASGIYFMYCRGRETTLSLISWCFQGLGTLFVCDLILHCTSISDKVILFLSDGRPTDNEVEILDTISEQNARIWNQVIIKTFGVGLTDGKNKN